MSVAETHLTGGPLRASTMSRAGGIRHASRVERRKLLAQTPTRVAALICLLGPVAYAAMLDGQSGTPSDSLFGVWVHASGYAQSLVLLSFAGAWGIPLLAAILAGDMFSAEDRHQTWSMLLIRSTSRLDLFIAKVLISAAFVSALVIVCAVSSLLAGVVFSGPQPLVGLSGQTISPAHAELLVLVSWLLSLLPAMAFTSLALLFSAASRNGIVGVIATAVVALIMQLLALIGSGVWVHALLIGSAFDLWHGLFTAKPFYGPLIVACIVSLAWTLASLGAAWEIVRRRSFAETTGGRPGWKRPVAIGLGTVALVVLAAVGVSLGPAGVTATRLQRSFTPLFNRLTLLQQRELGRPVPRGAGLQALTDCGRRSGPSQGPGDDWVCIIQVFTAQPGAVPFATTTISYDIDVKANGCYKADAPPNFIGQQLMRSPAGQMIVNPLFTVYGCFDVL